MNYSNSFRLASLAALAAALYAAPSMAGTMSLTVDGINAPIEILSFKILATNSASAGAGGGGGAGKVSYSDFQFKATESAASPLQLKLVSNGAHIENARFGVLSVDGARTVSEWVFERVILTSFGAENGAGDPKAKQPNSFETPVTTFSIAFGKVCYRVFAPNGAIASQVCWDIAANQGT